MTQDTGPGAPGRDPRVNVPEDVAATPPPLPSSFARPQAGPEATPHVPLGTFYRVNSSRASFGELRRDGGSPLNVLLLWLTKLLGVKLPGSVEEPNVETLAPFEVAPAAVPAEAMGSLAPAVEQLRPLGFEPAGWYAIVDLFHASRLHFAVLSQASGSAWARVSHRTEGTTNPPKSHWHAEFVTELSDGRFLRSTSAKAYLDPPAGCVLNAQVGMTPPLLWASHRQRLDLLKAQGVATTAPAASVGAADVRPLAREAVERHHARVRDECLRRRVFSPMTRDELERAAAADQFRAGAEAGQLSNPDVLAELDKLQNSRAGWGATILILVVSLAVFVGAGRRSVLGDWEFLLILVGVLFFHELGHYVAMRVFRYRNLRMFFIPMVGAAVTGRHYNVPGWKKVIVALAGPLPGIVVGGAIGLAGVATGYDPLLLKIAMLALILNGMNLLPVLPLDGGQVVHALLFARHPLLDVAFRAVAAGVLIAVPLMIGDRFLLVLGALVLISIPTAYRTAKIARELRREGLPSVSPDSQTIPLDVAQVIIARVRAAFSPKLGSKLVAQHVLNVYETINARPPRWPATLGLGALHGGSFVVALVLAAVIVLAQQPGGLSRRGLESLASAAARARGPSTPLDPAAIRTAGAASTADPSAPASAADGTSAGRKLLVAHFDDRPAADAAFDASGSRVVAGAAVRQFGNTVLLALPRDAGDDARRAWFDLFESRTKQVSVDGDESYAFGLRCTAPTEAAAVAIEREAAGYLEVPRFGAYLVPPWHPDDDRTPGQRERHLAARRTYLDLQKELVSAAGEGEDPELSGLARAMRDATRRGETAEVERLQKRQQAVFRKRRTAAVERARAMPGADPAVIDLFANQFMRDGDPYDAERDAKDRAAMAKRFGELPMPPPATQPTRAADRFSAPRGAVAREGRTVTFLYITFTDALEGPPALLRWLQAQGFVEFRYELEHFGFRDEEELFE